jgi:hypothetical protein
LVLATLGMLGYATGAEAAVAPPLLGTAESFTVLAGAGITNTGATTLTGDIGTFPTTSITGTATLKVGGANHAGDAVAQRAKTDLTTAYAAAAGVGPTSPVTADLGGRTLTAGVYKSASSMALTGALTLDAAGDPRAVFVFQVGSTLTTASASSVKLVNGTQSCNVFWQIGSSATLGTGSTFRGTILALTSITVTTNVIIDGRVLARNGAVTLDTDTITLPTCTPATTTTTSGPGVSTSLSPSPTALVLPKGVNAGTGGQAASHPAASTVLTLVLALGGALLGAIGVGAVASRRRR